MQATTRTTLTDITPHEGSQTQNSAHFYGSIYRNSGTGRIHLRWKKSEQRLSGGYGDTKGLSGKAEMFYSGIGVWVPRVYGFSEVQSKGLCISMYVNLTS